MTFSREELEQELNRRNVSFSKKEIAEELKRRGVDARKETLAEEMIRYNVIDPLAGALKFRENLINTPHNIAGLFDEEISNKIPKTEEMDYSAFFGIPENRKNNLDRVIQFSPELIAGALLPATRIGTAGKVIENIPKVGKYLKTALENAISQGALAASQSPFNQLEAGETAASIAAPFSALAKATVEGNPLVKKISRALLGTGAGVLGYEGAKSLGAGEIGSDIAAAILGIGGYRGFNPKRRAAEDVFKGVEGTNYEDYLKAADRLGLSYVTPAEASGNPFTGATQGTVGKTEEGSKILYKKGQERAASEQQSIEKFMDTIFNKEKMDGQVGKLYEKANKKSFTGNELDRFADSEIFQEAVRKVESEPAYRQSLKGVRINSVEYLDHVKRAMSDMIESAGKNEGRIIKQEQDKLISALDKKSPAYKEARQLANREILRREIEEAFNKKPMTATNVGKYLTDKKKFNKLQNSLRRLETDTRNPIQSEDMKKAQEQLNDMKLVFERLINIPTSKTAEALSRTSMSKDRASYQSLSRKLQDMLSLGRYDKAAVEMITNPKWADELKKLKEITDLEKFVGKSADLFGKAAAQGLGQQDK